MKGEQPSARPPEKPVRPLVEQFRRRVAERPGYFGDQARRLIAEADGQTAPPTITLYVRRGDSSDPKVKTRTVSLHPIPDKVSMDDLLAIGFGFDGDTVSVGVTPDTFAVWEKDNQLVSEHVEGARPWIRRQDEYERQEDPSTLADALNSVQSVLVKWLRSLGYEVKIA